jgi:hypothetical protein
MKKEIPEEYKTYYLIESGNIKEDEWKKLSIENKIFE